jgi:hypothetical protein
MMFVKQKQIILNFYKLKLSFQTGVAEWAIPVYSLIAF